MAGIMHGSSHEENALAELRRAAYFFLRLEFLERWCDPRDSTVLTLLRSHRVEGCPPLFNVLAFAVRTDNSAFPILRKCQDFREFPLTNPTEKIVLGHDVLT